MVGPVVGQMVGVPERVTWSVSLWVRWWVSRSGLRGRSRCEPGGGCPGAGHAVIGLSACYVVRPVVGHVMGPGAGHMMSPVSGHTW